MIEEPRADNIDAEIDALLDITNGNYYKAVHIVCESIQRAQSSQSTTN